MQAQQEQRGLATVKEAAEYLGLSVAKVYLLMGDGDLSFVKLGKSRRIAWTALEDLIRRCTVGGDGCAVVSERLGHSSSRLTKDVYPHIPSQN